MSFISGIMKSDHWIAKIIQCIVGSVALSAIMVVGGMIILYILLFIVRCISYTDTSY